MSFARRYFYGLGQGMRSRVPGLTVRALIRQFETTQGVLPMWCLMAYQDGYFGKDPRR